MASPLIESAPGFAHHGGRLGSARAAYPNAPQPWIDLSTGINPTSYPAPRAGHEDRNRLPDVCDLRRLEAVAAEAFGVPDPSRVVACGGTEPLLRLLPWLSQLSRAAISGPTYGSHPDAWVRARIPTKLIGDAELETAASAPATAVVIVNPNNPDGRILPRHRLQNLHDLIAARDGLLIVDEAFAEVTPEASVADLAGSPAAPRLIVLRSFGKFYGLAGLRLGFLIAQPSLAANVRATLGDWPVSVDALVAGLAAYPDRAWAEQMRAQLARDTARLDGLLERHGLEIVGGTSLYRLTRSQDAAAMFERLAAAGVLVRPFEQDSSWLRFGLPGSGDAWKRLADALAVAL